jgi:hypothetical protein
MVVEVEERAGRVRVGSACLVLVVKVKERGWVVVRPGRPPCLGRAARRELMVVGVTG